MQNRSEWPSWRVWAASVMFWGGLGCAEVFSSGSSDGGVRVRLIQNALLFFGPYALATPVLIVVTARLALARSTRRRFWLSLSAVVVGAVVCHALLVQTIAGAAAWIPTLTHAFHYVGIVSFAVAINERRLGEVRERDLLAGQLRALRLQLQPHFLFNTLHAIAVTGRTDSNAAARMLTLLGDLLRQTLIERGGEVVSLAEELELLQPYLELQQLRFPDRLRVELDFPEEVLAAGVPDLLLQPLVENALKHGIERRPEGGTVRIAARRWHDYLEIQVTDDGAGVVGDPGEVQFGIGLGATKARLKALFGAAADVTLATRATGGATVTLRLPYREVAHAA